MEASLVARMMILRSNGAICGAIQILRLKATHPEDRNRVQINTQVTRVPVSDLRHDVLCRTGARAAVPTDPLSHLFDIVAAVPIPARSSPT